MSKILVIGVGRDIPHYNLITMNGFDGLSPNHDPNRSKRLAENVEDDIREILEYHINYADLPEEKSANMVLSILNKEL